MSQLLAQEQSYNPPKDSWDAIFSGDFGRVNPKKIKSLVSAIDYYIIDKDLDVEVRFDIIAIIHQNNKTKIEHLEDAFLHF